LAQALLEKLALLEVLEALVLVLAALEGPVKLAHELGTILYGIKLIVAVELLRRDLQTTNPFKRVF
jgi:hypothetical protein